MPEWNADGFIKVGSLLGSFVAIGFTLYQYRRTVRTRRAEWLLSLFERFYERPNYQRIPRILDSSPKPSVEYLRLESDIKNESEGLRLKDLAKASFVRQFIDKHGFEELNALLAKMNL